MFSRRLTQGLFQKMTNEKKLLPKKTFLRAFVLGGQTYLSSNFCKFLPPTMAGPRGTGGSGASRPVVARWILRTSCDNLARLAGPPWATIGDAPRATPASGFWTLGAAPRIGRTVYCVLFCLYCGIYTEDFSGGCLAVFTPLINSQQIGKSDLNLLDSHTVHLCAKKVKNKTNLF